ncbi:DAK2 domain-containing protein, partial [Streptomyces inhibens]
KNLATEPGPAGDPRSAGTALLTAGPALPDASGGASGALYGALLAETGAVLVKAGAGGGGCRSALFADAADAADADQRAAAVTDRLTPARGRAARMGAPGYGHPDAGAVSLALILTAAGETLG